MRQRTIFLIFIFFCWPCFSLAQSGKQANASATPSTDVTGLWSGVYPVGENAAPFVLDFEMAADGTLSGMMYDAVYVEQAIVGNVEGTEISFWPDLPGATGFLTYSGVVTEQDYMSGEANCWGCPPPHERGDWELTRISEDCQQPGAYFVLNVSATSFVVTIFFGDFGGILRVYQGSVFVDEIHQGPGAQTFTVDGLNRGTEYTLCFYNHCEISYTTFSEPICRELTTLASDCRPPRELAVSDITANSFKVSAIFGEYGGEVRLSSEGFSGEYIFGPGSWEKTIYDLPAGTEFTVSAVDICEDGSFSAAVRESATTLSNRESNGVLTAPIFVDESHVRVTSNRELELTLEDPNADGWDRFGEDQLIYEVRIVSDCNLLFSADVSSRQYPYRYVLPTEIPDDDYEIHILRKTQSAKNGQQTSNGTVIVGPGGETPPTQIPTDYLDIGRWILHVPKIGGGFSGTLVFNNKYPELPAKLWVAGFDSGGNLLGSTVRAVMVVGQRAELAVYPGEGISESLFESNLTDLVSHLGLYEESGARNLSVGITYQNISDPEALTATLDETTLNDGQSVASQVLLEARDSQAFWDGMAILNLTMNHEVSADVYQRNGSDGSVRGSVSLGTILSGEKKLVVISEQFGFCEECYYTVETPSASQKIEVLGLRGSLVSEPPVLVESQVRKIQ